MIIRISSLGNCRRQVGYGALGVPESDPPSARSVMAMEMGTAIEAVAVAQLEREGNAVTCRQMEVSIGEPFLGHPDGVLDGKRLLEVKALNSRAWLNWKRNGVQKEFPQYVAQAHGYMAAMTLSSVLFYVVNRDTGETHEERMDFNPSIFGAIRQRWAGAIPVLERGELPEPDYDGSDWHCNPAYCRWSSLCPSGQKWKALHAGVVSSNGTGTVDASENPALLEAAASYREGDEMEKEGEALKDTAKKEFAAFLEARQAKALTVPGLQAQTVTTRREEIDKEKLKKVLGERYAEVVKTKETSYLRVTLEETE